MWVRTMKGELIYVDMDAFDNETEKYRFLWTLKYSVDLPKKNTPDVAFIRNLLNK